MRASRSATAKRVLEKLPSKNPPGDISNVEIVTLAVALLGGKLRYVDTEDVAIKAAELAPGRFGWRKYPDQVNLELVRVFLSDSKKPAHGSNLLGSGNSGWMLTQKGADLVQRVRKRIKLVSLGRTAVSVAEKTWLRSERRRLLATSIFAKFSEGLKDEINPEEANSFFRVDSYVTGAVKEAKVARLVNAFGGDSTLGAAVTYFAALVRRTR